MKTTPLLMVVLVAMAGCAQPAMPLRPRFPSGAETTAMTVADLRKPQPSFYSDKFGEVIDATRCTPPAPAQSQILGNMANVVLYLDSPRTVADAIATIVAKKYPRARVELIDCRSVAEAGVWMNGFTVNISVAIEHGGKRIHLNASGKNIYSRITPENFEKAFEAAIEELSRQVALAPPIG